MMRYGKVFVYYLFVCLLFVVSCGKEKKTTWQSKLSVPLMRSEVSVSELLENGQVTVGEDSVLQYVHRSKIYEFIQDSLMKINDTTFKFTANLESITLGRQEVGYDITLGELARQLIATGELVPFLIGQTLIANHGGGMVVPEVQNMTAGPIEVDGGQFFESIELSEGTLDVEVTNGFPIPLTNVVFEIRNNTQDDQTVLIRDSFDLINPGETAVRTASLDGKTIYSQLNLEIPNIDSPGSGADSVDIDTLAALSSNVIIRDLKPVAATAIFPAQNVVEKYENIEIGGLEGMKIHHVRLKEGGVRIEVLNTVEETVRFSYLIPSATFNGSPFNVLVEVPPGSEENPSSHDSVYNLTGYDLDLRGVGPYERAAGEDLDGNGFINNDTVNTFAQELIGSIDSTGEIISLSLQDSFYINAGLINIVPEFTEGYIGNEQLVVGPESSTVDAIKKIEDLNIKLEDVSLSMEFENYIGAKAELDIRQLKGVNTRSGNEVALTGEAIDNLFEIDAPPYVENDPQVVTSVLALTSANSNIKDLFDNYPDQFVYELDVAVNPDILTTPTDEEVINNPPNFIYNDRGLGINLVMEVPLSFSMDGGTIRDTSEFTMSDDERSRLAGGELIMLYENGFPLNLELTLHFVDDAYQNLLSLPATETLQNASVDANGFVNEIATGNIRFVINESSSSALSQARHVIIEARSTSADLPTYVKIRNNDQLTITLTGRFNHLWE